MTADVAGYIEHAQRYGPECVVETAAEHLSKQQVGQVAAWIDFQQRTHKFTKGEWVPKMAERFRACEECGRDLPRGANSTMLRHVGCRDKAKRRRIANRASKALTPLPLLQVP